MRTVVLPLWTELKRVCLGDDSIFLHAFKDKGRVSGMLDRVPVYAVLAEDIGLRGAALQSFQVLSVF